MASPAIIPSNRPIRFRAIGIHNITDTPQWESLDPDIRHGIEVASHVLPFRTNGYLLENLVDWRNVPADPIFQLVFPQREMLAPEHFREVDTLLQNQAPASFLAHAVRRIRLELNPHPAGQVTHNVPALRGRRLRGLQHKYRETVLFFPSPGQTCHAYCTYCFRWAQFVDTEAGRFGSKDTADLVAYLKAHREVTDVLITGGDPLVMTAALLRKYIEPLLAPELDHVQNIRIGTKSVAFWPYRFVSDPDADECLRLFEQIVASNRHLAIMGHYSHPVELEPEIAREAIRRVRSTGAQIRMQAPLVRHVNDNPQAWSALWRTGVRLGLIPYYMFVERDTGPRNYFEVPLARAHEIFRQAYNSVSGLARSVHGPSMSAFPGKVRILGITSLREMMGESPTGDPNEQLLVFDFIQARNPDLVGRIFFAAFDPEAAWLEQLRPAFGNASFPFESRPPGQTVVPAWSLTESLLH